MRLFVVARSVCKFSECRLCISVQQQTATSVYLLSRYRTVEAALRVVLNPVMSGLIIIILAVGHTAAAGLWGAADSLQLTQGLTECVQGDGG